MKELEEDYLSMGALQALGKFTSALGMGSFDDHGHQVSHEQREQMDNNTKYFITNEAPRIRHYTLDIDALKIALNVPSTRVIPAGGQTSKDYFPYHCAKILAYYLGVEIVDFPGNHAGYVFPQNGFAEQLGSILLSNE